jgi:hypothetical protein
MKKQTVGELRALIANLADETPIVTPVSDHNYCYAALTLGTALFGKDEDEITEDYGEKDTPEAEHGQRRQVLIVG